MSLTEEPRHPAAPVRLPPLVAAATLAMLLGLQPVTTDLYLPALPGMTRALSARLSDAQATMSVLILAFGFGQLFWGPVSDRVGRRPVLLTGLALYVLSTTLMAMADSIGAVIGLRGVQGFGMAASVVCARALVRDLYEPHEGMRVMSMGMTGLGLFGIGCPILGGVASALGGWRLSLTTVATIGAVILAFIAWRLPESVPQRNPAALQPRALAASWWRILKNPTFRAWAGLTAATYAGLFTFLSTSSFVCLGVLGLSPIGYGAVLVLSSGVYLAGTVVCRRWLLRFGPAGTVQRGAAFSLAGGLGMAACALLGVQTLWAVMLPQCLYAFGHGMHQPCGQAGAVGPFPREAGAASALSGFVLSATAFAMGSWLSVVADGTTRALGLGMGAAAIATAALAWIAVQRHGQVSAPATTPVNPTPVGAGS